MIETVREPAFQVSPKAKIYWAVGDAIFLVILIVATALGYFLTPDWSWKGWALAGALTLVTLQLVNTIASPRIRYRVARWEVTMEAIYTRSGWISRELRIAPLSRVQTVDSQRGPLMRLFGLANITVTTASAAGPITIEALDEDIAEQVVADLARITSEDEGDAT
ncbi:PH domain-containing protein [Ornithinimicrobium sp. Arc0846-15]|nr:PH domain-containing protein [Ornithinimicrobium laminariae]